jgi:DNA-directed RNA polymerase specialized sigma24 family protein
VADPPHPDAVDALVAAVTRRRGGIVAETRAVEEVLTLWLRRRGLTDQEREEVVNDAVMRLIDMAGRGRLDPGRPAGALLRVIADHLAIDALRRRARTSGTPFDEAVHGGAVDDESLSALLDRSAASADVRRALRACADEGRHELVRVITNWIALAAATGDAPTTREVAERVGVSHMTVQRALTAFGERLAAGRVPKPGPGA